MTEKKVLIVYGTRYGSTEGTSEKIAEILKENEINVDIYNLKATPKKEIPNINNYNGVIIGSSIKIGQWTKDVKEFVSNQKESLNSFKGKLGFFVSSGYAALPDMYEKVKTEYTKDALVKLGVEKLDHFDAFGGLMDFTKNSRMSWLEKKLLKMVGKQTGQKEDPKEYNDLRDWKQIEEFANGFLNIL